MKTLLKNGTIIIDQYTTVYGSILFDEKILECYSNLDESLADEVIDVTGLYVQPGFIDTHMHGAVGKDFIIGKDAVEPVGVSILEDGTTGFLASLTVLSHEEELETLKSLNGATSSGAKFIGVHMEGPYLSKEYKALMDERYLRDPSIQEVEEMLQANPNIKTMTIAPEREGMDKLIRYLVSKNIIPMIGHTACSAKEALHACSLGAKGFTHLYNAMSPHRHRDPGCATAALASSVYKEFIMDGFHNDEITIQATWKRLGPREIIMITDSMLGKGMPDGEYTFSGLKCRKTNKTVQVIDTGRIAGSAIGMNDAARYIHENCYASRNSIVEVGCINPTKLLGLKDRGTLEIGKASDIAVFNDNYDTQMTFVDGKLKYKRG